MNANRLMQSSWRYKGPGEGKGCLFVVLMFDREGGYATSLLTADQNGRRVLNQSNAPWSWAGTADEFRASFVELPVPN